MSRTYHLLTGDGSESLCGFRASEASVGFPHLANCPSCLARRRCQEGSATHDDRLLLSHRGVLPDNAHLVFGPVEHKWSKNGDYQGLVRAQWRHTIDEVTEADMSFETVAPPRKLVNEPADCPCGGMR